MKTLSLFLIVFVLNFGAFAAPASPAETVRTAFETGNYSVAVKTVTEAIAGGQQDPSLHYWALRSYYELHDYEKAIVHGEQAVKLDPANAGRLVDDIRARGEAAFTGCHLKVEH